MVRMFLFVGAIWLSGAYVMKYTSNSEWFWMGLLPAVYIVCIPMLYGDR